MTQQTVSTRKDMIRESTENLTVETAARTISLGEGWPASYTERSRGLAEMFEALEVNADASKARGKRRQCCHHWIIEAAVLPLSRGMCKLCGEARVFRNHLGWEEIKPIRSGSSMSEADESLNRLRRGGHGTFLPSRSGYGMGAVLRPPSGGY